MTPKEIGAAIKRTRKYKNWSQMLMAGKIGRSRVAITRAEQNTDELSLKNLLKVLELLDLELIVQPKKGASRPPEQLKLDI